nr:hypothetical protein [Acidobacteriota bacterium]
MNLLGFALGGALLGSLVHLWQPAVTWRTAAGYLLSAGAFFAMPLTTSLYQVPTDLPYHTRPWSEMVEEVVRPQNGLLSDVVLQMLPFRTLVRERLLHGEAPLWAQELGTGQPLLGNAQSSPFAPLHLLALPLALPRSLSVVAAWQVLVALLLTHALLLALGAGRAGAVFAAVAFAFSAFSICWLYYPLGMAVAWIPGVMLGLVLLRRRGRGGLPGLVVCGASLALSGHPETLASTGIAAAVVVAALLWEPDGEEGEGAEGRWRGRRRFLGRLAVAAVLSACLAAPALLPFLQAMPESARWAAVSMRAGGVQPPGFGVRYLLPLVSPLVFGSPRDGNWSGGTNFNELCSGYAGLLALALAVAGALVAERRVAAIVAAGTAAVLAALRVPPFFALVAAVPGLGSAPAGRLRLFWVLALAVAAGLTLEELPKRRAGVWAGAAALAAAAVSLALLPPPTVPWQRVSWGVTLAGCGVALAALLVPRLRRLFPWVAVACLGLDLGLLGGHYLPLVPARFDLAPPPAVAALIE